MSERQPKSDQVTPAITLELLNRIEENSSVTQRSLARELGIALGLANTYLKRCAKKGLIKIQHIPANRYAYYLTPKGFAEKSRLTSEYLRQSFQFFRFARDDIGAIFKRCEANGYRRLVLHGLTDLAEIALLCANEAEVSVVAIVDKDTPNTSYAGVSIHRTVDARICDAILVTDLGSPQISYDRLRSAHPELPVFAPSLLRVRANGGEAP